MAREESEGIPRRLVVQAGGGVVRVGGITDVFGGCGRAVLSLERDGTQLEEVLLLRLRHGIFAVVNRCPHLERPLEDARIRGHVLTCRGHGRSYSLRTGRPAGALMAGGPPKLRRLPAWAEDGQVFVDVGRTTPGEE